MGGFLLPNGDTTRIADVRQAGLPPWLKYQVHSKSGSGEHYANVYSEFDYLRGLINIVWCFLLSSVALLLFRKRQRKPNR